MRLPPLIPARLIRRYKRFLADVELENGTTLTVHCPNSGSMKGCLGDGWPVMLSESDNPKRKYPHTWEMVHNGACWIGINTARTNGVVEEGIRAGVVPELADFDELQREVKLGDRSRIDITLDHKGVRTWVEVKSVTMVDGDGRYAFPDAVTTRGAKHVRALADAVAAGDRGVMFFLVQRMDADSFRPADDIDPAYGEELRRAHQNGVEILVHDVSIDLSAIRLRRCLPFSLNPAGT